jgi:hypothetical protein
MTRTPPGEVIGLTMLCFVILLGVLAFGIVKVCEVGQ